MSETNPRRIAYCLEYPLALRGGVSVVVETLIRQLARKYQIVTFSPDDPNDVPDNLRSSVAKHFKVDCKITSRKQADDLARLIADQGVDLAHFHFGANFGWGSRIPGRCPITRLHRMGARTVSTVHLVVNLTHGYCGPKKPLWYKAALLPLVWLGKAAVLRRLDREIGVSIHDTDKLKQWYFPFRKKFTHIYHSRLGAASDIRLDQERAPVILNVGHIARRKGQEDLARAFCLIADRFPQWKLDFYGDILEQESADMITALAAKHGLEERITLQGSSANVFDAMRRSAIYAQPSREEALGLALQEAMCHEMPCIGTRVGGIPELIDSPETGILVPPGRPEELASQIERLIGDQELRQRLGANAANSIRKRGMTAEAMAQRHIELYERLIDGQ